MTAEQNVSSEDSQHNRLDKAATASLYSMTILYSSLLYGLLSGGGADRDFFLPCCFALVACAGRDRCSTGHRTPGLLRLSSCIDGRSREAKCTLYHRF